MIEIYKNEIRISVEALNLLTDDECRELRRIAEAISKRKEKNESYDQENS